MGTTLGPGKSPQGHAPTPVARARCKRQRRGRAVSGKLASGTAGACGGSRRNRETEGRRNTSPLGDLEGRLADARPQAFGLGAGGGRRAKMART